MSDAPNRQASLPSRRIPLDREISIQVPAFDSFVTEYSTNISSTGMFIKSAEPLAPDTEIAFEFRIADDWKLIHGEAKVVWCRRRDEGPERPAGMGVEFTDLEPQSRRLIDWIVEKHVREGGKPFDLDALRGLSPEAALADEAAPAAAAAAAPGAKPAPARAASRPATRPARPGRATSSRLGSQTRALPLLLAGFAAALLLAGLFWLSERGAQSAAEPELPEDAISTPATGEATVSDDVQAAEPAATGSDPAGSAAEPPPAATPEAPLAGGSRDATEPPAEPSPSAPSPAASIFDEAARRLVDGWSRAWSEQNVDAYLGYYARGFEPPRGQSRSAWSADRRRRLEAPEFIEITITDLEAELLSETRGRAVFSQGYRSNTYQDSVRKTLELTREDGRWKILEETSES